jgi:TonB family protein
MLTRRCSVTVFLTALLSVSVVGQSQTARTVQPRYGWSAVNSSGQRFTQRVFPDRDSLWEKDATKKVIPKYPYQDRARHHMGRGLFRMEIDLETGAVRKVTMVGSIGYNRLDESAIQALSQWRFRPNSWKEVTLPVEFVMPNPDGSLPSIPSGPTSMPVERGGGMRP